MNENSSTKTTERPVEQPAFISEASSFSAGAPDFGGAQPPAWLGSVLKWILPVVFLLIGAFVVIPNFLQKWLWMRELNFAGIFWTLFSIKVGMTCVAFLIALLFLGINIRQVARHSSALAHPESPRRKAIQLRGVLINHHLLSGTLALITVAIAALFAMGFYTQWDTYLRFRYGGSFGLSDPIFGIDLGFYIFRLPFYELLQSSAAFLIELAIVAVACQYAYFGLFRVTGRRSIEARGYAVPHVSLLLLILAATFGWGYYLDRFDLLDASTGVVYGIGYTTAHATLPALWVMIGLSAVACALLAFNFFRPRWKLLAMGAGAYVALYVIGIMVIPALVQKFVVQPNELALETPYLKNYIDFTRKGYSLDKIQETPYPAVSDLTPAILARNQDTIDNIRLWDKRPLLQTYQQTQAIRLYYKFYDVAVDRYHLSDGYHQVMLSTREIAEELPAKAQTWVNENLQFTHGYGLVMNFVSKTVGGGFPEYLIKNVPPDPSFGLNVTQPAIYFGEGMPGSRIVATGVKEFDYPKGNDNVYTSYQGKGGIPLDSLDKRILFALTQGDINILLTSYLKPTSRIQIWRDVKERVAQVAPFLKLDANPYPVLSEGKLYWIQDAYTTSSRFPYSNPLSTGFGDGLNYIRNSVKITVDMYDGAVSFYVMDPHDPVLAVYQRAFPGVFQNLDQLPADLKLHLRYPQDLFAIQAAQYQTFHMTDPQVFYNREDLWVPPLEKYDGKVTPMEPYYILMKLPGSTQLEYLLMTPFTPQNRDNMIAWLAARSDFPDYGKMLFYELPKDKLTYGPNQVGAMIDQSTLISQQLTLWDQKGSGVIRGKLIVIPIENSFLYIIPLYLRAEGTNFPQLKRVIAATGDKVVMEPSLEGALSALFGGSGGEDVSQTGVNAPGGQVVQNAPAYAATQNTGLVQERLQLQQVQKALDSLKRLLESPAESQPTGATPTPQK
jgi:uncharacterized membrane protein (UPF0182 family)